MNDQSESQEEQPKPYRPRRTSLPARDQQAEYDQRQAELDAEREEHNRRTAGE
jgi:hypothetical protein